MWRSGTWNSKCEYLLLLGLGTLEAIRKDIWARASPGGPPWHLAITRVTCDAQACLKLDPYKAHSIVVLFSSLGLWYAYKPVIFALSFFKPINKNGEAESDFNPLDP